ncbi:Digeranylgeranylglyceryl phosphate synthase [uncultured archaeon]|nr:Digeranylgeranylglyceryl phosphate synthase [uncultured archaeon]
MESVEASFLGSIKTFLELIRVRNAALSFVGVYLGALLTAATTSHPTIDTAVFYAALSAALIMGAGNVLNDYYDHEIDRINRPKRPIPSGRITRPDALMLAIAMFLIGLGLAKSISTLCLVIVVGNTIILVLYGLYGKTLLGISNFAVAYLVSSLFLYGAAAAESASPVPEISRLTLIITLVVASFFSTLSREIIKDVEDREGDMKKYSQTIPIHYGVKWAKRIAETSTLTAVIVGFAPLFIAPQTFNTTAYLPFTLLAAAVFAAAHTMHETLTQRMLVLGQAISMLAFYAGALL